MACQAHEVTLTCGTFGRRRDVRADILWGVMPSGRLRHSVFLRWREPEAPLVGRRNSDVN